MSLLFADNLVFRLTSMQIHNSRNTLNSDILEAIWKIYDYFPPQYKKKKLLNNFPSSFRYIMVKFNVNWSASQVWETGSVLSHRRILFSRCSSIRKTELHAMFWAMESLQHMHMKNIMFESSLYLTTNAVLHSQCFQYKIS